VQTISAPVSLASSSISLGSTQNFEITCVVTKPSKEEKWFCRTNDSALTSPKRFILPKGGMRRRRCYSHNSRDLHMPSIGVLIGVLESADDLALRGEVGRNGYGTATRAETST